MLTESIIYQTALLSDGRIAQQVAGLYLEGHNTKVGMENTGNGKLYGSFLKSGDTYTLSLYKDITKSSLVASASTTTLPAIVDLTTDNSSGLTGYVLLLQYESDDTAISIQALLSTDKDIPMGNLNTVEEYDPVVGFAEYHQKAMKYITKEFILARLGSMIYDPDYTFIPEGIKDVTKTKYKGYNLSKILNIESLKEASQWWALSRILEKHAIEPNSSFTVKAQEARSRVAAILNSVDLSVDTHSTGSEGQRRSLRVWQVGR